MIRCSDRKMLGVVMAWRQGQSYSEDLRGRVLAAIDGGMAARATASVFRVSVSYIYKALIRRRRLSHVLDDVLDAALPTAEDLTVQLGRLAGTRSQARHGSR